MLTRRELLWRLGMGTVTAAVPGVSFATAETEARLILVILRGAVDGLALVPPYGDGNYRRTRGELALAVPGATEGALKLDGLFGLHPSCSHVHELFVNREALVVHAVASPYRERSHFDGQDVLENGVTRAGGQRTGWLNRALAPLGGSFGDEVAVALSQNTPLVLRGDHSVTSWAPSGLPEADDTTLGRLQMLYAHDEFFRVRLEQALESQRIAGGGADARGRGRGGRAARFAATMRQTARFLTAAGGPRIAVCESGGWDTHANQGAVTGQLAVRFAELDAGIAALKSELGTVWSHTLVAVVTEFGRTVRVNGTRGTDHGTATAALLLGGAVQGGRVVTDWPGLSSSALYEDRDLFPTTDIRSVFKGVLTEHLGLDDRFVESSVFPGSGRARRLEGLVRV